MKSLLAILLCACCVLSSAEPYLTYDSARRVDFFSGGGYQRDEYSWFIKNTGEPSRLFLNGVYQSQETGTNDARFISAWTNQPSGVPVGVVDTLGGHRDRVRGLAELCGQTSTVWTNPVRHYEVETTACVSNLLVKGLRVIVIVTGWNSASNTVLTTNMCLQAIASNAVLVCSVPDVSQNVDTVPDYPSTLSRVYKCIIPATNTDRNGNLYNPAAWGTNVIGAPGRNIVAAGTYSSGTSYSAPIIAGAVSLLIAKFPNQSSAAYQQALLSSSTQVGLVKRLDAAKLLEAPALKLSWVSGELKLEGLSEWMYEIQRGENTSSFSHYTTVYGQSYLIVGAGFYRGRIL